MIAVLLVVVGPDGRPDYDQQHDQHHGSVPPGGKRCFSFPNVYTGSGSDSVFRHVKRAEREATARSRLVPDEE